MARPDIVVEFRPGAPPLYDPDAAGVRMNGLGGYITSPDDADWTFTDADIRIDLTLDTWRHPAGAYRILTSKWRFDGGTSLSWAFNLTDEGYLAFNYSTTGAASVTENGRPSTEPVPAADGERLAVRVTHDANNGAAGHTITFYTAPTIAGPWTQLGDPVVTAGTANLFDSTAAIEVGVYNAGNMNVGWLPLAGTVHSAEYRGTIGGTSAGGPDFTGLAAGTEFMVDADGHTWTIEAVGTTAVTTEGSLAVPWVDITEHVRSARWTTGRQRDDEDFPPGDATLVLQNHDRRFDPEHTTGPYFGDLLPRVPFRIRATYDGGTTFDELFYGFVEDGWEQHYEPPAESTCTVRLVDLLGVLAGYTLPAVLDAALVSLDPLAYWRLTDEPRGEVADLAGDLDGTIVGEPTRVDTEIIGGTRGAWTFNAQANTDRVDVTSSRLIPDYMVAMGIVGFRTTHEAEVGGIHPIYYESNGSLTPSSRYIIGIDEDGLLFVSGVEDGFGATKVSAVSVADGDTHIAFVDPVSGIALDSPDWTAVADIKPPEGGNGAAIGGTPAAPFGYDDNYFEGDIAFVALFEEGLFHVIRSGVLDAYNGLAGQRSDQHIRWALGQLGVPATMLDLDEGRAIMGAAETLGVDALDFVRSVTATEYGRFYVDHQGGGKLRFTERYSPWFATRETTAQAEFSDDPAALPADVSRAEPGTLSIEPNGVTSVVNRITVAWSGGEETVEDPASIALYGPRGRSLDSTAATPGQARGLAQWVLARAAAPSTRVRGFGIDPGAAEDSFEVATGTRIGDRVEHRSHPQATGSAITRELTVEGVAHDVTGMSWATELYTSTAPDVTTSLFILDTSELDSADVLAF